MKILTMEQTAQLIKNGKLQQTDPDYNPAPVVKLFTPDSSFTWLLTEYDPASGMFFGLCDLGAGFPELGYVSYQELTSIRGPHGLPVERDRHWVATKTLSEYAAEARELGRVAA